MALAAQDRLYDAVVSNDLADCRAIVGVHGPEIITALTTEDGTTPLHAAVWENRLVIVQWFLRQQIHVNALDLNGRTALMIAAFYGYSSCLRELLRAGADSRIKDPGGDTALEYGRKLNWGEVVTLLEEHERFLEQLGSHTKRALREPAPTATPSAELADLAAQSVCLMLDEQPSAMTELEAADPHLTESPTDRARPAEAAQQQQAAEMPALDLRDLDFELPE
eukprot:m.221594 g.221594  ORF g.221594 m.221594 type:complete len:223 (-) comp54167_c0_seq7:220-888(-)